MTDDIPPWVDEQAPTDNEPVTQSQHLALMRMVTDLKEQVRKLQIEVTNLQAQKLPPATPPGTLTSGKYAGKTRDWCVLQQPDYVVYLADNGWSEKWGFTDEQVDAARRNPKLAELQRSRR